MNSFKNIQLLIVEDEPNLADTLSEYLESKDFSVCLARNAQQARSAFDAKGFHPQVVLMDIGLPDGDGLELAREFRFKRKDFVLVKVVSTIKTTTGTEPGFLKASPSVAQAGKRTRTHKRGTALRKVGWEQ